MNEWNVLKAKEQYIMSIEATIVDYDDCELLAREIE